MKKFACGIPLYHPDSQAIQRIKKYVGAFCKIYLYDNTENGTDDKLKIKLENINDIEWLGNGNNSGLSVAYNQMCQIAYKDGMDFLTIFDQDSYPEIKYIKKMQSYITNTQRQDVAVYGPYICKSKDIKPVDEVESVDVLISSGSFINLHIYKTTTGFDEKIFIDKVDDDYCLMTRSLGYDIVKHKGVLLYHRIGDIKHIFRKEREQHSPLRMYYIARNTLYVNHKYGRSSMSGWLWLIDRIRHVALYDDDKISKIKMMLKGAIDYKKNKLGKYEAS